jgi:hypothetical protein
MMNEACPSKLRNVDFGGPAHRWDRVFAACMARRENRRLTAGVMTPQPDLEPVERYCECLLTPDFPSESLSLYFPLVHNAWTLWNSRSGSASKWLIEALLLLPSITYDEISFLIGSNEHEMTIAMYHRLFFDVDDHLKEPGWMHTHVWGPAKNWTDDRYWSDFVLKAMTYAFGRDALEQLIGPNMTDVKTCSRLIGIAKTGRLRAALNIVRDCDRLDIETRAQLNDITLKTMIETDSAKTEDKGDASEAYYREAVGLVMDKAIRNSKADVFSSREALPHIVKYTDNEVENGKNVAGRAK